MTHATVLPAFGLNDLPPAHRAAVSFLARYEDPTLALYQLHLRSWFAWCEDQAVEPLDVTRGHVELWLREYARTHKASTTCTAFTPVRGFYKYAYLDGVIDRDPAAYVRLPKVTYTRKPPVDRHDIRRFLATAREISPRHWCLTQLLAVMGLRTTEACSLTVEQARHIEQGMRVLRYIGKGSKPAETPIPYQSLAAVDAAIGDRTTGPLLSTMDGRPLTRHGAWRLVETVNNKAGLDRHLNPHYLRALAVTQGREAGLTLDEVQLFARHEDPATTKKHYDLTQVNLGSHPVHAIGARLAI